MSRNATDIRIGKTPDNFSHGIWPPLSGCVREDQDFSRRQADRLILCGSLAKPNYWPEKAWSAAFADLDLKVIFHERNQGRGATVTDGFRAAQGEITGYLDVDLEVHCRYVPSLVRALEQGADVATVRRIYAFQILRLDRYLMSRGYSFLVRRLLGVNLQDTETGFKFFRREKLLPILEQIRDPGWFWDTEFMVRALRKGLRIVEIPGAYLRRYDKTSTVRGLRDSAEYFLKLLRFRRELEREHP